MPAANISINSVDGSNEDLPINTVVNLNNQGIGGEVTYAWTILAQPPGTVDALSNPAIQNPTFTPKKEGSYLIKVVVNAGTQTEQVDIVVAAVRHLKTRLRAPAAGEKLETSASGWAVRNNEWHARVDALFAAEFGVQVGQASGTLNRGDVVRATGVTTIKSTLPGAEDICVFAKALATAAGNLDELLGVVEGGVDGSSSVTAGQLVRVRHFGLFSATVAGAPASGDPVYVSDAGAFSLSVGTVTRKVGAAIQPSGGVYRVHFFGLRAD